MNIKSIQMKTKKLFLCLVVLASSSSLHAQLKTAAGHAMVINPVSKTGGVKKASDNIKKAAIPSIKMPASVRLDLAAQMKKIKEQCPYLQSQKATLHLDGERTSTSFVRLEWETTNGWNNSLFNLERSLGDTFHFETVDDVHARSIAGVKDRYGHGDVNEYNKVSYYRVKLLLKNGSSIFSNIAPVKGYEKSEQFLYPNPAASETIVYVLTETAGSATISINDATGKLVSTRPVTIVVGRNTERLDLSLLTSGFYTVNIVLPDRTEKTLRLVKQ
jgi:hypothetical protein